MDLPPEEKREVPAYMVSFGDMITLLLTFFILLVALADTQAAGLVGAGRGPIVKHVNAEGQPGIMPGRLREARQKHKSDAWWIPSQEGDPDELERVVDKLERELMVKFKAGEAKLSYQQDKISLRLPIRIRYEDGRQVLDEEVGQVVRVVADALRANPERRVRINGDVPRSTLLQMELLQSANQGRLVFQRLLKQGARPHQMSLWGWGSARPLFPSTMADNRNQGLTIEILEPGAPVITNDDDGVEEREE